MVDGLYKYVVEPGYNANTNFETAHGLVNTAENRDVVCAFHSSDYGTMRFKLKGAEEGYAYTIYAMSGQESRATDFMPVTGGDGVSGTWEAEFGFEHRSIHLCVGKAGLCHAASRLPDTRCV